MPNYTITPDFLEYAKNNPFYIYDVLMVFVPDNSKKICIDLDEKLFKQYETIIKDSKDLTGWLSYLTLRKDLCFSKIQEDILIKDLPLSICKESFDKILITENESDYNKLKKEIIEQDIILLNKDTAKIHLNYSDFKAKPSKYSEVTPDNITNIIEEICDEFIYLVEFNGIYKLLYKDKKRVLEKSLQLIFFAIAFCFCKANNLKLSPEVNSGNGPVDFNFSHGFKSNVNVELKFADNPKLENGLKYQLESYNKAEHTNKSIYLVVYTKDAEVAKIDKLKKMLTVNSINRKTPVLKIVDAREKNSASNLKV
jgi:hypothetical protein